MGSVLSHLQYILASRNHPTQGPPPAQDPFLTPQPPPVSQHGLYFGPHVTIHPENFSKDSLCPTEGVSSEMLTRWAKESRSQLTDSAMHSSSTTLQALVNLRKNTFRIVKDEPLAKGEPKNAEAAYHLEFTFDALVPCRIRVNWVAKETFVEGSGHVIYESKHSLSSITSPKSLSFPRKFNQYFRVAFDPSQYSPADLVTYQKPSEPPTATTTTKGKPGPEVDGCDRKEANAYCPLIVVIEACPQEDSTADGGATNPPYAQSQATFVTFSGVAEGIYEPKVLKQTLNINNLNFILQDIYGFPDRNPSTPKRLSATSTASSAPKKQRPPSMSSQFQEAADASLVSRECVICISDPKSVAVLPCRHLCLCRDCAETLRARNNRCPICRSPFRAMICVELENEGDEDDTEGEKQVPQNAEAAGLD